MEEHFRRMRMEMRVTLDAHAKTRNACLMKQLQSSLTFVDGENEQRFTSLEQRLEKLEQTRHAAHRAMMKRTQQEPREKDPSM